MESENLSLLIWLSVSDGQKTDSSKSCIIYRYIVKTVGLSSFTVFSGDIKKKSSENDQLTGHFQSFFILFFVPRP